MLHYMNLLIPMRLLRMRANSHHPLAFLLQVGIRYEGVIEIYGCFNP